MTILFPPDALPKAPPVDVKKALLLIDLQNDFTEPDGKLSVPNVSSFLSNIPTLVNKFRSKGSVFWVRTEYSQPRLTMSPETGFYNVLLKQHLQPEECASTSQPFQFLIQHDPEAFLDRSYPSNDTRPCMPGTAGAQHPSSLHAAIDPKLDLTLVKSDYSSFVETSLLLFLRTRMITHVYVCGSLSNISVYATVMNAVRHGLEVTLVEDCLGYLDPKCHFEAVRQMADDMGANGVDYQELMDDLSGLLGDVIREEDFSSRFQVSIPPASNPGVRSIVQPHQRHQRVEEWIANSEPKRRRPTVEPQGISSNADEQGSVSNESQPKTKTSKVSSRQGTPDLSPPRKRSTSDLDDTEEPSVGQPAQWPSSRREIPSGDHIRRSKKTKPRLRNTRSSQESSTRPKSALTALQSKSTGDIPDQIISDTGSEGRSMASPRQQTATLPQQKKKKKLNKSKEVLGPDDIIGEGDSRVIHDIMPAFQADDFFHELKAKVQWQKMYHRSGEVPRLVAVQGDVSTCGNEIPIYRHPADESPELLAFDPAVDALRRIAEEHTGHALNHVLIQWYRSCEDNISEHSDKTLDIVRGSSIVNLSLGAQRTMTLRTKKVVLPSTSSPPPGPKEAGVSPRPPLPSDLRSETVEPVDIVETPTPQILTRLCPTNPEEHPPRTTQRIPLPHASLFVLGQATNQQYLHSIRADKRPAHEKRPEELAFNGERISLTFRHIGTFVNKTEHTIWGQGATSKTRKGAKAILAGEHAEREGEGMIRAFGVENHTAKGWDWEREYGAGFDVVDFERHESLHG